MHSFLLLSALASLSAASPWGHGGSGNGGWSNWWSNNHGGNNFNGNNVGAVSTVTVTAFPTTFTSNNARPTGTSTLTRNTGTTTATGAPTALPTTGPKINVSFYSDSNCAVEFSKNRDVFITGQDLCAIDSPGTYSSIKINSIDEFFIGSADIQFQIGNTASAASDTARDCDFNGFTAFVISNRDKIGQCQGVGIQQTDGGPTLPGNNYQIVEFV
jgi:hypothetical protein